MRTPYVPHVFGEEVRKKLRSRAGWLTAAVVSAIAWPRKDVWIRYGGDDFFLRGTENQEKGSAPAITVPCNRNNSEIEQAIGRIYRLCSVLSWFLEGYVDVVDYIVGSHPMGFGPNYRGAYSNLGQAGDESFDANYMPIIDDDSVRIALAFWREGQRLTNVQDSYAFLSYYKVIESQFKDGRKRGAWIDASIMNLTGQAVERAQAVALSGEDVGQHIFESGRCAVAHASLGGEIVDPDIAKDRRRIREDLVLMRELARLYIKDELEVPTARQLYTSRNRLTPWDGMVVPAALEALKNGQTPSEPLGLDNRKVSVALWPRTPFPGMEDMTMHVDAVDKGLVRIVLFNDRMTLLLTFVLDYNKGQAHTQLPTGGVIYGGDNEPTEEDVRSHALYFHGVIGNAQVELRTADFSPVDCEVVIPTNIIPRNPEEAAEEAVQLFRIKKS